jgi:hypothetical protein
MLFPLPLHLHHVPSIFGFSRFNFSGKALIPGFNCVVMGGLVGDHGAKLERFPWEKTWGIDRNHGKIR